MKDLFVVLRSSNERSSPLAEDALKRANASYVVIKETPFSAALKKMFEVAHEQTSRYLLALDADVILHDGALEKIVAEGDKFPNSFFIDFFVMDKFRGKSCSGCHLYRNRYARALYQHLNLEVDETRPENQLILDFAKSHHLSQDKSRLVVGLHDFEQYYRDLYAKYFRRALRRPHEAEALRSLIEERKHYFSPEDRDFEVVLKGLNDGMGAKTIPSFDARNYKKIDELMPIVEKTPFSP